MARTRRASSSSSSSAAAAGHRAPPPTAAAPPVTNVYLQQQQPQRPGMGGMGGGLLGTMASVAAGSVIGHGVSNMLFSRSDPPAQPAQAQEIAAQVGSGACAGHIKTYSRCLESNDNNAEPCKWAWNDFVQCQEGQTTQ